MTEIMNSTAFPRFINGKLTKTTAGELFLKTSSGSIPVRIEGASVPLDQETLFEFLRAEPGRLLLTPLTEWESLQHALPFLKGMPQAEPGIWEGLVKAAVAEELPLDQEVLLSLRKMSLTAEKSWGVKVAPRVFAFLLRKELPVTQATVLWALYTRYPAVQREVWHQLWLSQEEGAPAQAPGEDSPSSGGTPGFKQGEEVRTNFLHGKSGQDLAVTIKNLLKLLGEGRKETSAPPRRGHLQDQQVTSASAEAVQAPEAAAKGVSRELSDVHLFSTSEQVGEDAGPTGTEKGMGQSGETLPPGLDSPQKSGERRGKGPVAPPQDKTVERLKPESASEVNPEEEVMEKTLKGKAGQIHDPKEMWTEILKESSRFLAVQSKEDQSLAQLIFCLFPRQEQEIRCEARGDHRSERGRGYSFRLSYHSQELQEVELIGAYTKSGLELLIEVEDVSRLQPHFSDLKDFLTGRGWSVKRIRVAERNKQSKERTLPPRIDGWV